MDIKDKIRKLLALGTSPNENEAKAALLKAKKLMIDNKLTEEDFQEKSLELVHLHSEEVAWTTDSGDVWIVDLANLLANNYLCAVSWVTPHKTRTHKLSVNGLENDAKICMSAIEYAVGFVRGQIKIQQRKYKILDGRTVAKSYADGFILGMEIAFDEQKEKNPEWALVEVKPEKVQEYQDSLSVKSIRTKQTSIDPTVRAKGINDGMEFNQRKVIGNK